MAFATIDDLRSQLGGAAQAAPVDPDYAARMLHPFPPMTVVDRGASILARVKAKRVLELGASGPLHVAVVQAAAAVIGIDRLSSEGVVGFDLDDVSQADLPCASVFPEIVLCGEVLEHLSNPGWTLTRLRRQYPTATLIVSVPNAYTSRGSGHRAKGIENVNGDHVAWHSPRTLRTLLERAGYQVRHWHWYGGQPVTAEGILVIAEAS